ncbi:hypothetical protein ACOJBO_00245 [Rhizobium beringeri]
MWLDPQTSLIRQVRVRMDTSRLRPSTCSGDEVCRCRRDHVDGSFRHRYQIDQLLELYHEPLVLIRPDQIVAWRGDDGAHGTTVIKTVWDTSRQRMR